MRILDRSVYVGPSLYAHSVIRLELDLGALGSVADRQTRCGFVNGWSPRCQDSPTTVFLPRTGRFIRRMREGEGPGSARAGARRDRLQTSPASKSPSQTRSIRRNVRGVFGVYEYGRKRRALPPANSV